MIGTIYDVINNVDEIMGKAGLVMIAQHDQTIELIKNMYQTVNDLYKMKVIHKVIKILFSIMSLVIIHNIIAMVIMIKTTSFLKILTSILLLSTEGIALIYMNRQEKGQMIITVDDGAFPYMQNMMYADITKEGGLMRELGRPGTMVHDAINSESSKSKKKENMVKNINRLFQMDKTWRMLESDSFLNYNDDISQQWKSLGLNVTRNACCRIKTIAEPETKEKNSGRKLSLNDLLINKKILKGIENQWNAADQTDAMHVESIYKVYMRGKNEVDLQQLNKFQEILVAYHENFKVIVPDLSETTRKAISTEGTAGEFGKHILMEQQIKDKMNLEFLEAWENVVKIATMAVPKIRRNNEITEYRNYKKVEIIGNIEGSSDQMITRLLSAPNLVLRVTDSYHFHYLNEAIVEERFSKIGQVGINVFEELKWITRPWATKYHYFGMDFSNFDGTQHPQMMVACLIARLCQLINQGCLTQETLNYLIRRYCLHIKKKIKSEKIEVQVIGQQASGDITTSDDNTMRSTTFAIMVMIELEAKNILIGRNNQIRSIDAFCQGDDTLLRITNKHMEQEIKDTTGDKVVEACKRIAKSIGWEVKFVEHYQPGRGRVNFLGYNVEMVKIRVKWVDCIINMRVPLINRDEERMIGKLLSTSKITTITERDGKLNITQEIARVFNGKMLTAWFTFFHRPEIVLIAATVLIAVRSMAVEQSDMSYHLRLLKENILYAMDENESLRIQTTIEAEIIEVYLEEENEKIFLEAKEAFQEQMMNLRRLVVDELDKRKTVNEAAKQRTIDKFDGSGSTLMDNIIATERSKRFRYGDFAKEFRKIMNLISSLNLIRHKKPGDKDWWDKQPRYEIPNKEKTEDKRIELNYMTGFCIHLKNDERLRNIGLQMYKSNGIVKLYCSECEKINEISAMQHRTTVIIIDQIGKISKDDN